MEIAILESKIRQVMDANLSMEEFAKWYEDWFPQIMPNKVGIDTEIYKLLDNLFADMAYFEPNAKIRKQHRTYFGHDELLEMIKTVHSKLSHSHIKDEPAG